MAVEGRACVGVAVAQAVRELFLEQEFEPELLPNSLVLALLTKFFKVITSSPLMKGNLLFKDARTHTKLFGAGYIFQVLRLSLCHPS